MMKVEEIMTKDVITVSPKTPIHEAAELMIDHGVSGLPVVDDAGSVVGIVSEGDLIKALAKAPVRAGGQPSDERLVREMRARLAEEPWVSNRGIVVQAKDGVLSLWGLVLTETEKSAVETMARTIEGSKGIDSHLVVKSEFPYRYAV